MDFPIKKYLNWPVVLVSINVLAVVVLVAVLGLGLTGNKAVLQNVVGGSLRGASLEPASWQTGSPAAIPNLGPLCVFDVPCVDPVH